MSDFVFGAGLLTILIAGCGIADMPPHRRAAAYGVTAAILAALVAWLAVFRFLFGVAS